MAGLRSYPFYNSATTGKRRVSVVGTVESGAFGSHQSRQKLLWDCRFPDYSLDKPASTPTHPRWLEPCFGLVKNSQTGLHLIASASGLANQSKPVLPLRDLGIQMKSGLRGVQSFLTFENQIQSICEEGHIDKALDALLRMDNQDIAPSENMFRSILKLCTKRKALTQVRQVHALLARNGLDTTRFLGEYLVNTLAKCGSLEDALHVFWRLRNRTTFSWTAMISGYATAGQDQEALGMYRRMQEDGYEPDKYTFISLLKVCGSMSDLELGKRIHAEAIKYKCASDLFVGTCIVDMYAKCDSLADAQIFFDALSHRDLVAWNAMLAACALQGQPEKALQLYEQMLEGGINPDDRSFVSVLQACGMLVDIQKGKAIHFEAWRRGYRSDAFIGSALVCMYSNCGRIKDAHIVFDALLQRDVVSWTAMLSAHVQLGRGEDALKLYEEMQIAGICPDSWIFVNVLQACRMFAAREDSVIDRKCNFGKALQIGKAVHAQAWNRGFVSDVIVGNALMSMYGECDSIDDALLVFHWMVERNVVSWTAMLTAHLQQGQAQEAIETYGQMLEQGLSPNDWTLVAALQACGILADMENTVIACGQAIKGKSLERGKTIHFQAWKKGYEAVAFLGSALISLYGKCGSILDSEFVFDGLVQRNIVSWNAMFASYVLHGEAEKTLELFEAMSQEGVSPDDWTFVSTLQACGMLADKEVGVRLDGQVRKVQVLQKGKAVHADTLKKGFILDLFINNTLISMYGKSGSILDAQNVFDGLSQKDVVSWNVLLAAFSELGQADKALELYKQMQNECMSPHDTAIVHVLQACGNAGALDTCILMHYSLVSNENAMSPLVASALIHAYCKLGRVQVARDVFDALLQPDVVSWTALIAGYAREGSYESSLQCMEKMQLQGVKPNAVTFLSLLSACSHAGMVDKGIEHFEHMSRCHGIVPQIEHYVSLVDLLGKAGHFGAIEDVLSNMPLQPNLTLWLCLLSACRKHSNVEMGRYAFNCAVRLQPHEAAAHILMSNIYADCGNWDDAPEVIALKQKSLRKQPGQSWIEHEQKLSQFKVGDKNHLQQGKLYELLQNLRLQVK